MREQSPFNFTGVIFLVFAVIFGTFLVLVNVMYKNVKQVEATIINLHDQMTNTTKKLETINKENMEEKIQPSEPVFSYGKNWQNYVHQTFGFQFKSPVGWGNFEFKEHGAETPLVESPGKYLIGNFNFKPANEITVELKTNDNRIGKILSSEAVRTELAASDVGDCGDSMFNALKALDLGELRNCGVKENIMKQKYLVFRFVTRAAETDTATQTVSMYPMKDYYLAIKYPDRLSDEENSFIQSFVFETSEM